MNVDLSTPPTHPVARALAQPLSFVRWLLPMSALLTLIGYVGPWVPHRAAGLVITGLDLAEYVKFLHPVRTGEISIWRQGFYLPLVAISIVLSLHAYRRELRYPWPISVSLLILAGVSTLNLLPPAWSPALLITPEFRLQSSVMVICLGLAAISPILALLPGSLTVVMTLGLGIAALIVPVASFLRILPALNVIYNQTLTPGWGVWAMGIGLMGIVGAAIREKDRLV